MSTPESVPTRAAGSDWYGLSRDGELMRMTGSEMAKWARQHGKFADIGWMDKYTFGDDEVESSRLKGARFVRAVPGSRPSDRARAVGWEDLARALEAPVTPEEINVLPERIRRHICDLATISDPAGMVQEIAALKDQVAQLTSALADAKAAERETADAMRAVCQQLTLDPGEEGVGPSVCIDDEEKLCEALGAYLTLLWEQTEGAALKPVDPTPEQGEKP